jgi:hypothetical protein
MDRDKQTTPVVFRMDPRTEGGQCFALLPTVPATLHDDMCDVYCTVGGHCGGDYYGCIQRSRPATPKEYRETKAAMEQRYGYRVRVIRRAQRSHHEQRRADARRMRGVKP